MMKKAVGLDVLGAMPALRPHPKYGGIARPAQTDKQDAALAATTPSGPETPLDITPDMHDDTSSARPTDDPSDDPFADLGPQEIALDERAVVPPEDLVYPGGSFYEASDAYGDVVLGVFGGWPRQQPQAEKKPEPPRDPLFYYNEADVFGPNAPREYVPPAPAAAIPSAYVPYAVPPTYNPTYQAQPKDASIMSSMPSGGWCAVGVAAIVGFFALLAGGNRRRAAVVAGAAAGGAR